MKKEIKIVLIDLDKTLWRFDSWNQGVVSEEKLRNFLFPEALEAIELIKNKGYKIGIASASPSSTICHIYLDKLFPKDYFDIIIIHPTYPYKTYHFNQVVEKFGYSYNNILMIDDLEPIIDNAKALGVQTIHAKSGLSKNSIIDLL